MFRGSSQAFASDSLARELTRDGLAAGDNEQLASSEQMFFLLPLEHSENLADQTLSVELFSKLAESDESMKAVLSFAQKHKEAIEKFGRFPGRNAALGRESTPEELEWMKSSTF